ncbi:MAG: phage holin family protein [Mycobacterium sp.]|uniref:phage holin family protein n=1 Tax=Mycobacterium sp. TaxID=1785 RepID=UPI003C73A918
MHPEPNSAADAPIGELFAQLSAQTTRLVRDEMRLAQREFVESAKHAGIGAGLFSVAGLTAVFGVIGLITAAIGALALVLPVWAASLIIAAALFVIAGIAGLISKQQLGEASPTPDKAVANIKQDINEVKGARRDRR